MKLRCDVQIKYLKIAKSCDWLTITDLRRICSSTGETSEFNRNYMKFQSNHIVKEIELSTVFHTHHRHKISPSRPHAQDVIVGKITPTSEEISIIMIQCPIVPASGPSTMSCFLFLWTKQETTDKYLTYNLRAKKAAYFYLYAAFPCVKAFLILSVSSKV